MWRSVECQFGTEVSGEPACPILKGQEAQILTFIGPSTANTFSEYNQQDANYNWINQLSNTTIWWLIYVVYYIAINYMFRLLRPSSGW